MEKTRPIWKSILFGTTTALITMVLLSLLAAMLINKSVLAEQSDRLAGIVITMLASFAGGIAAARVQKGKLLLSCLGSSLGFVLVLLMLKAAFIGEWQNFRPVIALGTVASGMAASLMPAGQGKRRKRR